MNVFLLPMVLSSCALTPKSTLCKSGWWVVMVGLVRGLGFGFSGGLVRG